MKQVHANYTFVASTKTITLTGLNIAQDQLLLVTNATRGVIYYNFASSSHRAVVTAGANTTVVLTDASTTGHADSDQLTIHYDDQLSTQTIAGTVTANNILTDQAVAALAEQLQQMKGSLQYLTEARATDAALSDTSITEIASIENINTKNIVGAIIVIPYFPTGGTSGVVRFKVSGSPLSPGQSTPAKLADGSTPSYMDAGSLAPLFLPPNTRNISIQKVNTQGAVSGAGIVSTQDMVFVFYRAPDVDYDNPPYSLTTQRISGTVTVGNSVTIGSLPAISGTVTVGNSVTIGSLPTLTPQLPRVTFIDGSGTVVTANSAVTLFASSSTRSYLLVQVTTGSAFVNVGATATTLNGISLTAGQGYAWETTIPQGAVSLISTTTNSTYVAKQA